MGNAVATPTNAELEAMMATTNCAYTAPPPPQAAHPQPGSRGGVCSHGGGAAAPVCALVCAGQRPQLPAQRRPLTTHPRSPRRASPSACPPQPSEGRGVPLHRSHPALAPPLATKKLMPPQQDFVATLAILSDREQHEGKLRCAFCVFFVHRIFFQKNNTFATCTPYNPTSTFTRTTSLFLQLRSTCLT